MLKAGVLGAGHLGKIHLRLLNQSEKYELIGFYDADVENAKKVESEFGYTYFNSIEALIEAVDMVFYGMRRDEQQVLDVFIALSDEYQLRNLFFPPRNDVRIIKSFQHSPIRNLGDGLTMKREKRIPKPNDEEKIE